MRYALLAPGKRLRPAMALMAAEACGACWSVAMPAAVAVEMVHAYSLVHDDLPAMDDDDLRRGRPTCHIQFDEATAILAGDALLARAFEVLATDYADAALAARSVAVLGRAAGAGFLVGGQADDLAAERDGVRNLQRLEAIHRRKTGALFAASLQMGALAAGADQRKLGVLDEYADCLGLAFQVVDDLLDHTSSADELGKRTGKDVRRGKLTYPGLLGLEGAQRRAEQLVKRAQQAAALLDRPAWRLQWLAAYVLQRTR